MPDVQIKIKALLPDPENPRTGRASDRLESMQRIIDLQRDQIANLALDISEYGLSPIERLMVLGPDSETGLYTVVEGNRRAVALLILENRRYLDRLEFADKRVRNRFQKACDIFDKSKIEPISAYLAPNRDSTKRWIRLRHTGRNDGRGVSPWNTVEAARFAKGDDAPIVAVSDLLLKRGSLSNTEIEALNDMPWSTFERFIDSPRLRAKLGLVLVDGQLHAVVDQQEVVKALRELAFVVARGKLGSKTIDSRSTNTVEQRLELLDELPTSAKPDLSKKIAPTPLKHVSPSRAAAPPRTPVKKTAVRDPLTRDRIVGRSVAFTVSESKAQKVLHEMSVISVKSHEVAIAVLLRTFFELSLGAYLKRKGLPFSDELHKQVKRAKDKLIADDAGVELGPLAAIIDSGGHKGRVSRLHSFVHDKFSLPSQTELNALWTELEPFITQLWDAK